MARLGSVRYGAVWLGFICSPLVAPLSLILRWERVAFYAPRLWGIDARPGFATKKRRAAEVAAPSNANGARAMSNDPLINWDCEFFTGENERLLLQSTLNTIEIERLPNFIKMLNEYLLNGSAWERSVIDIVLNGCEDAIVQMDNGTKFDICSETTFSEILEMIEG